MGERDETDRLWNRYEAIVEDERRASGAIAAEGYGEAPRRALLALVLEERGAAEAPPYSIPHFYAEFDRKAARNDFAAAALSGWLASFGPDMEFPKPEHLRLIVGHCFTAADAMLAESESKERPEPSRPRSDE